MEIKREMHYATMIIRGQDMQTVKLEAIGEAVTQWSNTQNVLSLLAKPSFWPLSRRSFDNDKICEQIGEAIRRDNVMGVRD